MQILQRFQDLILTPAMLALASLAFLYFMYGLYTFMQAVQKGGPTTDGKNHMLWGIVGMFIIVSTWSIITIIANTIGVDPRNPVDSSRLNNINSSNPAFNAFNLK
jgi:hypothetical protein